MLKILIIGGKGEISSDLHQLYGARGEVSRLSRSDTFLHKSFDLSNPDLDISLSQINFDFAIFSAGITGEASCRSNACLSHLVNVKNTIRVLDYLSGICLRTYFLSSSLCFETEMMGKSTDSLYVEQKLLVEKEILKSFENVIIVRPAKVIGKSHKRFEDWKSCAMKNLPLEVPDNIFFAPISTKMLSDAIFRHFMLSKNHTLHISSNELVSFFELAKEFFKQTDLRNPLIPIHILEETFQNSRFFLRKSLEDQSALGLNQETMEKVVEIYVKEVF